VCIISFCIITVIHLLTRRVSLVKQELLSLPEHLSSPPVFSGVRVTRSLVLYVCFVDRCLFFCTFSFGHCVVCSSSIYGFWFFKLFLILWERDGLCLCNQCLSPLMLWVHLLILWKQFSSFLWQWNVYPYHVIIQSVRGNTIVRRLLIIQ
jgi:hypothetical protein